MLTIFLRVEVEGSLKRCLCSSDSKGATTNWCAVNPNTRRDVECECARDHVSRIDCIGSVPSLIDISSTSLPGSSPWRNSFGLHSLIAILWFEGEDWHTRSNILGRRTSFLLGCLMTFWSTAPWSAGSMPGQTNCTWPLARGWICFEGVIRVLSNCSSVSTASFSTFINVSWWFVRVCSTRRQSRC